MYRIEDSISAVKELQRLLGLKPTGNYDKKTKDAVLKKQSDHSLKQTGITDYETFTSIVRDYKNSMSDIWESDFLVSPDFPYRIGSIGNDSGRINEALSKVLKEYFYEGIAPRGRYLGEDTFSGVRYLQKIFGMTESNEIDARLMNRILIELNAIKIKTR